MKTRMQPIGNAWNKLPRLVRDLSHEMGKKIELTMIGAETERIAFAPVCLMAAMAAASFGFDVWTNGSRSLLMRLPSDSRRPLVTR